MDIQAIATAAITLLTPYIVKASGKFAEKTGEMLYEQSRTLYETIKEKFKGDQTAESTLSRVEDQPKERVWQEVLRGVLIMKLEEDVEFLRIVKQLVTESEKISGGDEIHQHMEISGKTGDVFQIGKIK